MAEEIKLLLVEDSDDDSFLIVRRLRKDGLNVKSKRVFSIDTLKEAISENQWDVVISDNNLPGFNATTALELFRKKDSETPFIIVSGTIGEESAVAAMRGGANDFIMKDSLGRLAPAIRRELKEKDLRSKKKEAEQALHQNRIRLELALWGGDLGLWDWFVQSGAVFVNERWANMLNYPLDEFLRQQEGYWFALVHPDDQRDVKDKIQDLLLGKNNFYKSEHRILTGDNEWKWVLASGKVVEWDDKKQPVRVTGTHLDITEIKKSQEEVIIREKKFRSLIEKGHEGIVVFDSDELITYVSPSVGKIIGFTEEEIIDKQVSEAFPNNDLSIFLNEVKSLSSQANSAPMENRFIHKNGHYVWLETVVTNLCETDHIQGFVANFRDITLNKVAQQKLQDSEESLRNLTQSISDIFFAINDKLAVTYWNDATAIATKLSGKDAIGKSIFDVLPQLKASSIEQVIQKALDKKEAQHVEFNEFPNAENKFYDVNVYPSVGGLSIFMKDISERVEMEKRLKSINDELETFMYRSSHDIKGPASSIKGLIDIAKHDVKDPVARNYLNMIDSSTQRLTAVLEELINVAKIKQGTLKVDRINIKAVIEEILLLLQYNDGFSETDFEKQIEEDLYISSDKNLMTSILQNIIENSIKYRSNKRKSHIVIDAKCINKKVEIKIKDNGQGMSVEAQERVFDMFYRANEDSKGSGLGLYITKNAIAKLHGNINMKSVKDEGTEFILTLPNLNL